MSEYIRSQAAAGMRIARRCTGLSAKRFTELLQRELDDPSISAERVARWELGLEEAPLSAYVVASVRAGLWDEV